MSAAARTAAACAVLLLAASVGALLLGARTLAPGDLLDALQGRETEATTIMLQLRLPRLLLGILVGAALGLAGAVIQMATRNPLGDPGLLGINAGASLAVILGAGLFGATGPRVAVWLAALGAACAAFAAHAISGMQGSEPKPIRLTLAGIAVTALCVGVGQAVALADPERFDLVRNWRVGSLSGDAGLILPAISFPLLAGGLLALLLAPGLNLLALGEDRAAALGLSVAPVRAGCLLAVVLLSGAAVAAAGPIAFIGLAAPHMARRLAGVDARLVLPLSALIGAALVVAADALGRVAAPPAELPVGIVAGLLGAPLLLLLVRRRKGLA